MENTNVLKTALGVGVLGTAAVALGFYYFNEDDTQVESELHPIEPATSNVDKEPEETVSKIASDVISEIASKKSQMKSFWESTYKNISQSNDDTTTQENNNIISN